YLPALIHDMTQIFDLDPDVESTALVVLPFIVTAAIHEKQVAQARDQTGKLGFQPKVASGHDKVQVPVPVHIRTADVTNAGELDPVGQLLDREIAPSFINSDKGRGYFHFFHDGPIDRFLGEEFLYGSAGIVGGLEVLFF